MSPSLQDLLQPEQTAQAAAATYPNYFLIGLCTIAFLYFFPAIIALLRGKNFSGVLIVNLVLGWTMLGWCVALIMACGQVPPRVKVSRARNPNRMTLKEIIDESRIQWHEDRQRVEPRL